MVVLVMYDWVVYRMRCKVRSEQLPGNLVLTQFIQSVKWVGLFVTALVGMYTVEDLWEKFGDLKMPVVSFFSSPADTSFLSHISSIPANIFYALGRTSCRSNCHPSFGLHGLLQVTFHDS
jgi:dolichyl-phosphate-mannose--protein O-mannosyl transferase